MSSASDTDTADATKQPSAPPHASGHDEHSEVKEFIRLTRNKNILALFDFVTKLAAVIGILYGTFTWVGEAQQRKTQATYSQEQTQLLSIQMHAALLQAIDEIGQHGAAASSADRRAALEILAHDGVGMISIKVQYVRTRELYDLHIENAELAQSKWDQTDLIRGHLHGDDLTGAVMTETDLQDADLSKAVIAQVNFTEANLSDANLRGATGAPLAIAHARWDGATCPDGSHATPTTGDTCSGHFLPSATGA